MWLLKCFFANLIIIIYNIIFVSISISFRFKNILISIEIIGKHTDCYIYLDSCFNFNIDFKINLTNYFSYCYHYK